MIAVQGWVHHYSELPCPLNLTTQTTHVKEFLGVYGQQGTKGMLEVCTQLVGAVQIHLDDMGNAGPRGLVAGVLGVNGGHAFLLPRVCDLHDTWSWAFSHSRPRNPYLQRETGLIIILFDMTGAP